MSAHCCPIANLPVPCPPHLSSQDDDAPIGSPIPVNSQVPHPNPETDTASTEALPPPPEDPILLQHDVLLEDFDRIYPIPNSKLHVKHPNFEAMKKYIFDEDVKRQMRLRAPLQQRKTASAAEYELNIGNGGVDAGGGGYNSRGDSWITGNAFGRRVSAPMPTSETPKAVPTAKQVAAADRLSKGFSTKEKRAKSAVESSANVDNSWYLSDRVLKASEVAKNNRKRIELNAQRSAEVAVKPVVFDFNQTNFGFGGL